MTQALTAMDTAIIDRWLARQEGMPPGDVLGATIVRSLREQLIALTARAVRAEQLLTELQQATCRALYRVNERLDKYVMDEAFGWTNGSFGTDCGEALDALRKAAGVTVRKDDHGFLEFVKVDTPRPATP